MRPGFCAAPAFSPSLPTVNTRNPLGKIMRTMIELLIRLQEMRTCCERVKRNPQLTVEEKSAAYCFKNLVRDCLPREVLVHYDRLKQAATELLECPEVFAMAVLVSTYRSLSPRKRRRLVQHFTMPQHAPSKGDGWAETSPRHAQKRLLRRGRRRLVARH